MISVQNLTKTYGTRVAVKHLNFEIQTGEVVGFLGPNGAGKSTTLKMITGHIPPTEGQITVNGISLEEDPIEVKKTLGYLPETPPVYFDQTVEEYLEFCGKLHQMNPSRLKAQKDLLLQKTGLTDQRYRLIGNLSKGTRQRVGIAGALVHEPKTIILDETSSSKRLA
jgi:ABC-2 type transport system ATP-binding protein